MEKTLLKQVLCDNQRIQKTDQAQRSLQEEGEIKLLLFCFAKKPLQ